MTREETIKAAEILKACSDGEEIQFKSRKGFDVWHTLDQHAGYYFDFKTFEYRIKPKYRPFKDTEECWQEMLKHQPFGWLVNPKYKYRVASRHLADNAITLSNGSSHKFSEVFKEYTFVDGTPFGFKVEEE